MASGKLSTFLTTTADPFPGGYQLLKYMAFDIRDQLTGDIVYGNLDFPSQVPLPYTGVPNWYTDFWTTVMQRLADTEPNGMPFNPDPWIGTDPSNEVITWAWRVDDSSAPTVQLILAMNSGANLWNTEGFELLELRLRFWQELEQEPVPFAAQIEALLEAHDNEFNLVVEEYKSIE